MKVPEPDQVMENRGREGGRSLSHLGGRWLWRERGMVRALGQEFPTDEASADDFDPQNLWEQVRGLRRAWNRAANTKHHSTVGFGQKRKLPQVGV